MIRGTLKMEIMHWVVFMVTGPFYSVWRRTGQEKGCANCRSSDLIVENSIAGRKWLEESMGITGMLKAPERRRVAKLAAPAEVQPVVSKTEEIDPRNYRF